MRFQNVPHSSDSEVEIERQCGDCRKVQVFKTCSDRTHVCGECGSEMKGVNAFRDFSQRVRYYRDALDQCMSVNPLILPFLCSMITSYCAEPPRFGVGQKVDYYHVQKQYFIKTKVLRVKYGATEQVLAQFDMLLYKVFSCTVYDHLIIIQVLIAGTKATEDGDLWMDAHDEKLKSLDIFRPDHNKDVVDILCGKCGLVLYEELRPYQYVVDEPTQHHFSFELFTNKRPKKGNVNELNGVPTQLNCKRDCHAPLWLIDHQSGYIDLHGHQYGLACGRTYAVARLSVQGTRTKDAKGSGIDEV